MSTSWYLPSGYSILLSWHCIYFPKAQYKYPGYIERTLVCVLKWRNKQFLPCKYGCYVIQNMKWIVLINGKVFAKNLVEGLTYLICKPRSWSALKLGSHIFDDMFSFYWFDCPWSKFGILLFSLRFWVCVSDRVFVLGIVSGVN